jgi:nitroreductase
MKEFQTEDISRLIRSRRSVYPPQYTGEIIDQRVIEEIIENANWAPTHKRTEPWRFVVFSGSGLKTLAEFMAGLYKDVTTQNGTFNEHKHQQLSTKPLKASHIISIGMKRDEKEQLPEVEEIESVACAVQNMCLTATAHGIGCYWGSGGITYFEQAKPFFGLGIKDRLLGFLYMGVPRKDLPDGKRKPIADKVRWVHS